MDYNSPVMMRLTEGDDEHAGRRVILNIADEMMPRKVAKWLQVGDELCRGRMTPMSSELTQKVRDICVRCQSSNGDTALMLALEMGLMDMVWGFIECANQTNTNLVTGKTGDKCVRDFFWLSNKEDKTAFDIAIEKDHVEVARLLLNNAPRDCLKSQWNKRRTALLHLLDDPKYDRFVFYMSEYAKTTKLRPQRTSAKIHSQNDELKIYNKGVERIVPPVFLDNLGNGLLGSDGINNTALHIVSKIGNVACIKYIFNKDPSQIYCHNSDMETPAYVAAREGRVDILECMINFFKEKKEDTESIVTRSTDNNNALHIAIQNHHIEVVFLLIKEVPQLANRINESKESPLYLAAERRYSGLVELLLNVCKKIAFEGPNGKTALHAAAISDSPECIEYLLKEKGDLLDVKDDRGWTALHHAVYHNSCLATTKLLNADSSIGYRQLIQEDGKYTSAIHLAASRGHYNTIEVLLDLCPGCSEFIDGEGRNILHVAVENKKNKAIEFIFRDKSLTNLINRKDKNGNTPIHLLVASDFELMETLIDSRVNINILNNEQLTPLDKTTSKDQRERLIKAITKHKLAVDMGTSIHNKTSALPPKLDKSGLDEIKPEDKRKETNKHFVIVDNLVVVAALIATASFAAAFTVPGGLNSSDGSKQGTPYLLTKSAFKAFIVTNAIAFSSACSVLLGHIALVFYRNRYHQASLGEQEYIDGKIKDMYYLTTLALFAMTIAFVTGIYVVLTPTPGLAISVCVMSIVLIIINMHKDSFKRSRKAADPDVPSYLGRLLGVLLGRPAITPVTENDFSMAV